MWRSWLPPPECGAGRPAGLSPLGNGGRRWLLKKPSSSLLLLLDYCGGTFGELYAACEVNINNTHHDKWAWPSEVVDSSLSFSHGRTTHRIFAWYSKIHGMWQPFRWYTARFIARDLIPSSWLWPRWSTVSNDSTVIRIQQVVLAVSGPFRSIDKQLNLNSAHYREFMT